ncbi:hypothetical protein D3C74_432800 [compost metagenome]
MQACITRQRLEEHPEPRGQQGAENPCALTIDARHAPQVAAVPAGAHEPRQGPLFQLARRERLIQGFGRSDRLCQ